MPPSRPLSLCLVLLALLAGCRRDDGEPLVSLEIPTDPHAPVVAEVAIGGVIHPLIVDTGATDIVLDLVVAQRLLKPVAGPAGQPAIEAKGLHGPVRLHRFSAGRRVELDDWRFDTDGTVLATDMAAVRDWYPVHGVLGMQALSKLNWLWDNRKGRLLGYAPDSPRFAAERDALHCEDMLAYDGIPGLEVETGNGVRGVLLLDSGDLLASGGLSEQDRQALHEAGAIGRVMTMPQPQRSLDGGTRGPLQMMQLRNLSLGELGLDGLFMHSQQGQSRLSRGFFAKFDRIALDFHAFRFCHPANASMAADALADHP